MVKRYYDLQHLLDCKCYWMVLYGMRSNGKSYAVKKKILEDALNGITFVYLRRWDLDVKGPAVESYFDDMPFNEITGGKYQGVKAYQGYIYFYTIGEDDKPERVGAPIGRYCALNLYERYKSQVFKNCGNVVYEEFLTDKVYLNNEPKLLMQFVSTVARDRDINVFMIGNTISRVCPYFDEWGLAKGIHTQKPGTINIYHLKGENGVVDIAVENCETVITSSKMFFGNASKQIIRGEWDVDDMPKLLKPHEFYSLLYELTVTAGEFKYIMQLLSDDANGGLFVYVYPNTRDRKTVRILTPEFTTDPWTSNGLRHDIKAECVMADCIRKGKLCYSDNLTGTDFKKVINNYDLRNVL